MKTKGFTLIEILVVIGSLMLIISSIGGVIFGIFRSSNKNESISKINQNGNWIIDELKKNILNASSSVFICPADSDGGNSITVTSVKDGETTEIACLNDSSGYTIASISAKRNETIYLFQNNKDLLMDNCNNFVSCSFFDTSQLSKVSFNFKLTAGSDGLLSKKTKSFLLDVNLRN